MADILNEKKGKTITYNTHETTCLNIKTKSNTIQHKTSTVLIDTSHEYNIIFFNTSGQ